MAKINTTFSFQDQITAQLNNLNKTLAGVLDAVKATQNGMKGANEEIENTSKATKKATGGLSALSEKLLKFNLVVNTFHSVKGAIDGVTGAVGGLNAMWQAQQDSEARLGAVMQARFHSDAQGIADMTQYLDEFSKGSAYNKTMLTNAAQELGTYIESADTLKGLLPMLTSMSQQAGINNEQGLMSMATMIGKVMGGDMGGLSKRGWQFTESEKEAFKTMSEMERLNFLVNTAKENIGEQDKAIAGMMANLAKQRNLENLQMKLGGLFNPFFDAVGQAQIAIQTEFFERIIPIVEKLQPVFNQMTGWVTNIAEVVHNEIDNVIDIVQSFVGFIQTNANQIVIIVTVAISVISAAIVALGVKWLIVHRKMIIESIKAAISIAVKWIMANAALFATIAIIIAIIAAIGLLLAFSSKTFPAIAGFFSALGESAKAIAHNIKVVFLTAIEGIVNGFLKMKDKVSDFFIGMLDTILGGIEKIAPAIDAVFKTDMTGKIGGFRETLNALKAQSPEEFKFANKGDMWDIGAHWRIGMENGKLAGADASDKFQGWISNKLEGIKNLLPKMPTSDNITKSISAALDDKFSTDGSGSLETKDKTLLEISSDYRELLTQAATRRFNLKFQQVTPNVTISGVQFGANADLDTVIEKFTDKIEEVSNSALAG